MLNIALSLCSVALSRDWWVVVAQGVACLSSVSARRFGMWRTPIITCAYDHHTVMELTPPPHMIVNDYTPTHRPRSATLPETLSPKP